MIGVVKRLLPADVRYGDHAPTIKTSAVYGVFCNGIQKATIRNSGTGRYMAPTDWSVEFIERAPSGKIRTTWTNSFKEAKAWAVTNVCK